MMKMTWERRALDKVYRRRDRYDIPDWQRGKVWDRAKKQKLIDTILRGWRLPKFYFVKVSDERYEVVDGQQRLQAIWEFFSNELPLGEDSVAQFAGAKDYQGLPQSIADAFDDFEIEYDVIENATDEELRDFFLRLQSGLPLTSSEKMNAVESKLTDFCRVASKHSFLGSTVSIPDSRYAHFDIVSKVVVAEIEGLDAGFRFDDMKAVFESQRSFSSSSAVAKRLKKALDFLDKAFGGHGETLRTRTVVQSLISLTCKLVATGKAYGLEPRVRHFFETFAAELARQVELGQSATDSDYIVFQRSVSANVRGGAKMRHEILLRKLFLLAPEIADAFDPSIVAESGVAGRISALGESIAELVHQMNKKHSASHGEDLFRATNDTVHALTRIRKPAKKLEDYGKLVDDLYFLFRESLGDRLGGTWPESFSDVNLLRTDRRHDTGHGSRGKVRSKRRKIGSVFAKYAGSGTCDTIAPAKFPLVQANLMGAIEGDLRRMLTRT